MQKRTALWPILVAGTACAADNAAPVATADLHIVQTAEIGGGEGEGALSDVFGLAVAADGRVYVSEPQFGRVVEFKADGTFARTVGGPGKGPGEFQVPGGLFWRGDSLAVADFTSGISLVGSDGTFHERISFILSVPGTPFGGRPLLPLADGTVGVVVPTNDEEVGREVWLKTSRTGEVLDTLAILPVQGRGFSFKAHGRRQQGSHPVAWAPLIAMPPEATGFVLVEREPATTKGGASFKVLRVNLDGDTVASREVAYVPRPLSQTVVDSITGAMAARMAQRFDMTPAALAETIRDQLEWPSFAPPVSNVLVGSDGSVWLAREATGADEVQWDISDVNFETVGRIRLPKSLELKVVSRASIWAVQKDSLGVPHVLRFDVAQGG